MTPTFFCNVRWVGLIKITALDSELTTSGILKETAQQISRSVVEILHFIQNDDSLCCYLGTLKKATSAEGFPYFTRWVSIRESFPKCTKFRCMNDTKISPEIWLPLQLPSWFPGCLASWKGQTCNGYHRAHGNAPWMKPLVEEMPTAECPKVNPEMERETKKIMRLWMLRLPLLQSYLFRKLVRYSIFQYFLSMLVCIKGWKDEKDLVQGKGSLGDGCNCIPVMEGVHGKKGGNKRLWWWTCWLERFISINASPGKHVSFRTFLHFWSEKNLPKKSGCPFPYHPCMVYLPTFTIKINQM